MARRRSHSPQTVRVLRALASEPGVWRYGYDLAATLDLKSGSLYPILIRLRDRGFLESRWEAAEPGRPPRHIYRLTASGAAEAETARSVPPVASRSRRRTQVRAT